MHGFDKVKKYTSSICEQIRWKKAHSVITNEIENHIADQKDAFVAEGMSEENAIDKAITEMGDPVVVGSLLDRTHRPKTEWSMIALTVSLIFLGLIINFFINNEIAVATEINLFNRTAITSIIGIVFMIGTYFVDFTIIGKYPKIIFVTTIIIMFPFFTNPTRWIYISFLTDFSQHAFFILLPTAYSGIIYSMRTSGYWGIILCGFFYVIPIMILLSRGQGISNIIMFTIVCLVLLIFSICKGYFNIKRLKGLLIVVIPTILSVISIFSILNNGYRAERFANFMNPYDDPYGLGYIAVATRDIISGAKFWGQGSLPTHYTGDASNFIPSVATDYLLTYLIHRIGWISLIVILVLFLALIIRGFYLCFKQKSILGGLVTASILLTLIMQIIVYISSNLGFQLLSHFTLPFISYGGRVSSGANIVNLALIGLMLSVFKTGDLFWDKKKINDSDRHKFLEVVDGKIIIDFKA